MKTKQMWTFSKRGMEGWPESPEAIVGPTCLNVEKPKQNAAEKIKFFSCNHLCFANPCSAFCICLSTTDFTGIKLRFKLNPREFINPLLWIRQLMAGSQQAVLVVLPKYAQGHARPANWEKDGFLLLEKVQLESGKSTSPLYTPTKQDWCTDTVH